MPPFQGRSGGLSGAESTGFVETVVVPSTVLIPALQSVGGISRGSAESYNTIATMGMREAVRNGSRSI